jgi:hypothetical protein
METRLCSPIRYGLASPWNMQRRHLRILTSSLIIIALACISVEASCADDTAVPQPGKRFYVGEDFDNLMSVLRETMSRRNLMIASGLFMVLGGDSGRATAQSCIKAALLAELAAGPLKYATNRRRPAGTHSRLNSSFPSSHAAMSYAIAVTLSKRHPKLSIPAYALAGLVSYSRVYHRRHHVSDVAVGALIGILAARYSESRLADVGVPIGTLRPRPAFRIDEFGERTSTFRMYLSTRF